MNSLFILSESFTNGFRIEMLDFISLMSIICGILVIISKNPVVSVLFLIGLFLSIASYLLILGISFIGLSYLLVYVGAVSILFLFILMLINVRISELLSNTSQSLPLAIFIGIAFNFPLYNLLPFSITSNSAINGVFNNISSLNLMNTDKDEVFFVSSKIWDGNLSATSHITSIGNIMYTSYSIWLILTSIILLLAMVGAIVITIKKRRTSTT